jgi:hypothetical protein
MGIKLFNCLPLNLKQLYKDVKRFKLKLKEFLVVTCFIRWMSILNVLVGKINCILVCFMVFPTYYIIYSPLFYL